MRIDKKYLFYTKIVGQICDIGLIFIFLFAPISSMEFGSKLLCAIFFMAHAAFLEKVTKPLFQKGR